jgi:mannose-6-phosphate isomerase-like protein (cupin superfamily)
MSFERYLGMGGAGRGTFLGQDEGGLIELPGWRMRIKVSASDTAGAMTLIEARMDGGHAGPAEHIHIGHDEAFFVISGQLKFRIGDGYRAAVAGESVFASRGLAHGFSNPQSEEARYLVALTPSGYEFYFERLAGLIRKHGTMPSQEELVRLMAEYGTFLAAIVDSQSC